MPEVTNSSMPSMSDEVGGLNYSVHIHTPPDVSSSKQGDRKVKGDETKQRQLTPLKTQGRKVDKLVTATTMSLSSAAGIKIKTEVEVHQEDDGAKSDQAQ